MTEENDQVGINTEAVTAITKVVNTISTGLADLHREVLNDRSAREEASEQHNKALEAETTTRSRLNKITMVAVAIALVLSGLVVWQFHRETVHSHEQRVAQCHTSNSSREGIRIVIGTMRQELDDLTPPGGTVSPQLQEFKNLVNKQLDVANAKFLPLDCSSI